MGRRLLRIIAFLYLSAAPPVYGKIYRLIYKGVLNLACWRIFYIRDENFTDIRGEYNQRCLERWLYSPYGTAPANKKAVSLVKQYS